MTRTRPPLSALVSRCCHAPLTRERLGLRCTECGFLGAQPMTVKQLEDQAKAAVATAPVTPTTGAALERARAVLFGEAYD